MLRRGCRTWRGWDAPKGKQSRGGDAGLSPAALGDPRGPWGAQEPGSTTPAHRLLPGGEAALLPGCCLPARPGHRFHRSPPFTICSRRLLGALPPAGPPTAAISYYNPFRSIAPQICILRTCVTRNSIPRR